MYFLFLVSFAMAQDSALNQINANYDKSVQVIREEIAKNRIAIPAFRPKSCPLISIGNQSLYEKFKGIEEGLNAACAGSNATALASLNSSITELDGLRKNYNALNATPATSDPLVITKPPADAPAADWEKYNTAVAARDAQLRRKGTEAIMVKNVSTAMSSISAMSENKDCKNSFSREKVFNLVSDIVVQTSGMGLLVPNAQGYMIAAGGMAFGAILKILNELLKQEFDWQNRDARDVFLKMNCTFFDLKKEMDNVGLLHVRIAEHADEIAKKRASIQRLEPILKDLYKSEARLFNKDKIVLQSILMNRMGEDNYKLLSSLNEAQGLIQTKGPYMTTIESKAEFLKSLYALHKEIYGRMGLADVGKYGRLYYLDIAKRDFMALIEGASNEDEFLKTFLTNPAKYKALMDNFLTPVDWIYSYQKDLERQNYAKAKGFAAVVNDPLFKHKTLIKTYEDTIDTYKTRVKFLNNITNNTVFSPDDDGTRIKANVIENFRGIEDKLYGKIGYSFNNYILMQTTKDFANFYFSHKFMADFNKAPESLNEKERMTYCGNAKRLQVLYGSASSLLNLSYDFMETNKDSFYKPQKRIKLLGFIPIRRSDQRYIYENALSAFDAKEKIKNNDLTTKNLKVNSLGFFMVKVEAEKPKLIEAQRFIDQNKCAK
jgi:hypothetical protein